MARAASHAGSWYTRDSRRLGSELAQWLDAAPENAELLPSRALICPHAGYSYSGAAAGHSYRHLKPDNIKRIFILGPSHHVYLENCALSKNRVLETPVGDLQVDTEVNRALAATGLFDSMTAEVDEEEHSIEMQLPYIAARMQGHAFTVVPVLVGNLSTKSEVLFGGIFAPYFADESNFFVISSDFCHWGKRFRFQHYDASCGPIHKSIAALDRLGMDLIEAQDTDGFAAYLKKYRNTICGRHPIAVFLHAVRKVPSRFQVKFVHYSQSSPCVSQEDSSVSYAAAVVAPVRE